MTMTRYDPTSFRTRLGRGDILAGTFIKTPGGHAVEIMGDVGLDFVVIDEEHAPFDRQAIDQALVAARAGQVAALVRVASAAPSNLLSVLDSGATGVLVPHVASVEMARDVIASCHYVNGRRGFSSSPRAGRYGGLSLGEHVKLGDAITTIVAQIEDPEASMASMRYSSVVATSPWLWARVRRMRRAFAKPQNRSVLRGALPESRVMVFVGNAADAQAMRSIGATAFIYSSDQGLMRQAAVRAKADITALT